MLQVLEGEEEGLLGDQEEEVVVVDLTYLQVEEVEVAVHLYLEEEEEEDIVGEEELGILSLESIFGDIEGEEVEEDVGGGTEGSNSDMVARLFLMRPMLKQLELSGSPDSEPMDSQSTSFPRIFLCLSISSSFSSAALCREPIASKLAIFGNKYLFHF